MLSEPAGNRHGNITLTGTEMSPILVVQARRVMNREKDRAALSFGMTLSLLIGALMLVMKVGAYLITGSAAILSDAAESVVHVVAVGFAFY
ncbi:MAG TPA: hypothetical protein ENO14_02845, partial [Chromatiales bacterium]|nr:hypothetical protein [Chromatiales bacterium]